MTHLPSLAAVVIGRNEGTRLLGCLDSLAAAGISRVVYVDSGSTDGSAEAATARGAIVVRLSSDQPFTAARARNAGLAALEAEPPEFVQLIDGDCALDQGWISLAVAHMATIHGLAIACGRVRERFPEISPYNRLCDREWDTPIGIATACGGNALARYAALASVGHFNPNLIAGEEPDLCLRLRRKGWQIERLDAEMVLHDAAITRFSQFWRRARRAGHAFAEGQWRHRNGTEGHYLRETRRALFWGMTLPLATALCFLIHPVLGAILAAAYPAQVLRLTAREGFTRPASEAAILLTVSKFAEAQGVIGFHVARLIRRRTKLIEYK
ncbi:glycosyltransferase [Fuscovulum ytuae]|uniref:Glycosyltransferase family A protein n=1 Tax=Fuscovulum ytuae TaxID=3042299 RepID=A0ABY8Q5K5_9RHOB|nr:glycosyltransferase family A protein [Fuscovulum sp. YMD61]WGV15933.1 glycosyltransferase family A protein [Fuscovulum sp. YMD61]